MLQDQGQDLDHLPVATWRFEQMLLQRPEGRRHFGKGGTVTQGPGFALEDGQIMPPIIDRPAETIMRAGEDPAMFAFAAMVDRMKTEERFDELFHVDDDNFRPYHHHPSFDIRFSFRWRKTVEDAWTYGAIPFSHTYKPRPQYGASVPKRQPSAAKRQAALQEYIGREWERLYGTALCTVRDFFQAGGDGSSIPEPFRAVTDSQGYLNNFSARWWRGRDDGQALARNAVYPELAGVRDFRVSHAAPLSANDCLPRIMTVSPALRGSLASGSPRRPGQGHDHAISILWFPERTG